MLNDAVSGALAPTPPVAGSDVSPVFILTASRSGSTLLRFILDSHPQLACPPETSIAAACAQLSLSWDALEHADDATRRLNAPIVPTPQALLGIRDTVERAYGSYLERRGKRRWCDKSLDNFQYTELIHQIYPAAKFICLYRHCMDVIASAVEACPWGLHRFGFDGFVAQNPGNSVAAVGSYWLNTTQTILAFEEKHPASCYRVRYEDLVTAPEKVVADIFSFLGEQQAPGITRECFRIPHEGNGSGDEKLWFTADVNTDSLGRGVIVPSAALQEPLRRVVNDTLAKLDYKLVDDEWNSVPGPIDPRTGTEGRVGRPDTAPARAITASVDAGNMATVAAIAKRIATSGRSREIQVAQRWPALAGHTIKIVVASTAQAFETLTWTVPELETAGSNGHNHGEKIRAAENPDQSLASTTTIIAQADIWDALLNGASNAVTELTAGRLRCVNGRDKHRIRSDELHAFTWLLGIARTPLIRSGSPD